jgi:hypothetical protein
VRKDDFVVNSFALERILKKFINTKCSILTTSKNAFVWRGGEGGEKVSNRRKKKHRAGFYKRIEMYNSLQIIHCTIKCIVIFLTYTSIIYSFQLQKSI